MAVVVRNNNKAPLVMRKDEYTPQQRRVIEARLAKADRDIKTGRVYGPFDTAEEMAASIEANIQRLRKLRRKTKSSR